MSTSLLLITIFIIGYLIGSIPFSFIIGKINGVDIRKHGSGNIGATNVIRTCGKTAGILAYLFDIGKGTIAALLIILIVKQFDIEFNKGTLSYQLFTLSFFTPIIGHTFPIFLKFKGGKGVAVTAGILIYLIPVSLVITLAIFLMIFITKKIISLASIIAAIFLPIFLWIQHFLIPEDISFFSYKTDVQKDNFIFILSTITLVSLFIIYKHRSNIKRLIKGEEYTFNSTKKGKQ